MALFLTRAIGESIMLSCNIKVTVSRINGRFVGLGIEAPDEVKIVREEIMTLDDEAELNTVPIDPGVLANYRQLEANNTGTRRGSDSA